MGHHVIKGKNVPIFELDGEFWLPIDGLPGYEVSNMGRVKSMPTKYRSFEVIMKPHSHPVKMYPYVRPRGPVKKIHRLVAKAFLLNPNNLPLVNHKDGNKMNPRLSNVEFCDNSYNQKHAHRIGLTLKKGMNAKRRILTDVQVREIRSSPLNTTQLGKKFGVHRTTVIKARSGVNWSSI